MSVLSEETRDQRLAWRVYYEERRATGWKRKWKPPPETAASKAVAAIRRKRTGRPE